jgi:hypothetical protein
VYPSGIDVRQPEPSPRRTVRGIRGEIRGFSKASKRRLNRKLLRLDFGQPGWYFVTLTYPGDYPADPHVWKLQLAQFGRILESYSTPYRPGAQPIFEGAIWRLERQKRGAPHFHLLVKMTSDLEMTRLREWVRQRWTKVLGGAPRNANWVRTQVQEVELRGHDGVSRLLHYLAKYLGKRADFAWLDELTGEMKLVGRMWGEWGKLPYAQPVVYKLSAAGLAAFVRRLRKWGRRSRFFSHLTVDRCRGVLFGSGDRWARLLTGLASDSSPPFEKTDPSFFFSF